MKKRWKLKTEAQLFTPYEADDDFSRRELRRSFNFLWVKDEKCWDAIS